MSEGSDFFLERPSYSAGLAGKFGQELATLRAIEFYVQENLKQACPLRFAIV